MRDLFSYEHFTEFVVDWLEDAGVTREAFARSVCVSPGQLSRILGGKRSLGEDGARRFSAAMQLGIVERDYFHELVRAAELAHPAEIARAQTVLGRYRKLRNRRQLVDDSLIFLSRWYYSAIRELAWRTDFVADPAWIAAELRPAISPEEATEALERLKALGLLEDDAHGVPRPKDAMLATEDEVQSLHAFVYHRQMIELAMRDIEGNRRPICYGTTLAVPTSMVSELDRLIHDTVAKAIVLAESARETPDRPVEEVVQIHLHLFPLAESVSARATKRPV